jgi:hypothetical protein
MAPRRYSSAGGTGGRAQRVTGCCNSVSRLHNAARLQPLARPSSAAATQLRR